MHTDIHDIADKAARSVLGKYPTLYTPEDWEDARQEALCGIISSAVNGEAGLFQSARYAIMNWLDRWHRHRSTKSLSGVEGGEEESPLREPSTTFDANELRRMLIDVRANKPDARTLAGIDKEIEYLRLKCAGYSVHGIMMELGMSEGSLSYFRDRLRKSLEMIANGTKWERKPYPKEVKRRVKVCG